MAEAEAPKRTKRRLRAPTQTVRERADQAQITADKPVRDSRLRRASTTVGKPLGKPARLLVKIFDRQPFRFIGRIIFPRYFREAYRELRLVVWPNRRTSRQLTIAVLGFAIVFGAVVALVDYGLDKVFKAILLK